MIGFRGMKLTKRSGNWTYRASLLEDGKTLRETIPGMTSLMMVNAVRVWS
jgi:hypothetical protein